MKQLYLIFCLALVALFATLMTSPAEAHMVESGTCNTVSEGGVYHTEPCFEDWNGVRIVKNHRHESSVAEDGSIVWKKVYEENPSSFKPISESNGVCTLHQEGPITSVVECFVDVFKGAGLNFITKMLNMSSYAVTAFIAVALIFFGIKMAMGEMPIRSHFFTLALKVTILLGFATNPIVLATWLSFLIEGPRELGGLILSAVDRVFDGSVSAGEVLQSVSSSLGNTIGQGVDIDLGNLDQMGQYCAQGRTTSEDVFSRFDCILLASIGSGADLCVEMVMNMFVGGQMWMGALGILSIIVALASLVMLLMTAVQSALIYITSVVALTFLVSLTPLMLGLWLFGYFRSMVGRWAIMTMGYAFQPLIMFAFMGIMLIAMSEITTHMRQLYGDACQIAQNDVSGKTTRIFSLPESQVAYDQRQAEEQAAREEEQGLSSETPITSSTGHMVYQSTSSGSGGRMVYIESSAMVGEKREINIDVPILNLSKSKRREYVALHVGYMIFLWVMLSFLRQIEYFSGQAIARVRAPGLAERGAVAAMPVNAYETLKQRITGR